MSEEILYQSVVGMEQAPQGSVHSPELPEIKGCLGTTLRDRI